MKNLFWTLPFLCFLTGYQAINLFTIRDEFQVPAIVGLPLTQAIKILSDHHLNVRIVREQEDEDLPAGTVLSQTPHARYKVKPQQSVFIVITKKLQRRAPECTGKNMQEIETLLRKNNLRAHTYHLPSSYPVNNCFCQWPSSGETVEGKMTLYISTGDMRPIIFPSLKGQPLRAAQELLKQYQLNATITHRHVMAPDHECVNCLVVEQKPLPGSLMELSKPGQILLEVE